MARKRQQGTFEDLIDIAAMLPWWAGVTIALISYFVLHHYATVEIVQPTSIAQMGANVSSQLGKMLATFGQYLIPLAFIIGAGISAYGRHKRSALFAEVQKGSSVSILDGMSWQEFEMLVGEAFRQAGYSVTETGGCGADGGIDLALRKDGEKYLVQCKQWRAYKVGVPIVRELYGVMAAEGAAGGFVVTSGVFTREAQEFAAGRNVELIDGAKLKNFIRQVRPVGALQNAKLARIGQVCPKCGAEMIKRSARHGDNAGKQFWGCSNFPQCRGIVPIN